ncbi:hypothetical protein ABPG77_007777 [Micractinium sp. CCAP 211/92]
MGRRKCILAVLLLAASQAVASDLSPPWWATYSLFHEALRRDRCLNISTLEAAAPPRHAAAAFAFNVTLLQCENATDAKLAGLATFFTARLNFGGTLFISRVLNSSGHAQSPAAPSSPAHALRLAGAALAGNAWFVRTATSSPLPCLDFYWVVLAPEVAQVWVDNLADLWGNVNLLAADLFARVMRLERFGLRAATLKFEPHTLPEGQQLEGTGPGRGQGQGQAAQRPLQPRSSRQQELACAPGQRCYHVSADPWEDEGRYATAAGGLEQQYWQQRAGPSTLPGAQGAAAGEEQPLRVSAFEQLWRQDQLHHAEQQAVVAGGTWQRRVAAASRAGGKSAASSWQTAAQCWALGLARSAGGEWAAQRAQRWLGLL